MVKKYNVVFQPILTLMGHGELSPRNSELNNLFQYVCAVEANEAFCENYLFLGAGFDPFGFNQVYTTILY